MEENKIIKMKPNKVDPIAEIHKKVSAGEYSIEDAEQAFEDFENEQIKKFHKKCPFCNHRLYEYTEGYCCTTCAKEHNKIFASGNREKIIELKEKMIEIDPKKFKTYFEEMDKMMLKLSDMKSRLKKEKPELYNKLFNKKK